VGWRRSMWGMLKSKSKSARVMAVGSREVVIPVPFVMVMPVVIAVPMMATMPIVLDVDLAKNGRRFLGQ